MRTVQFVKFYRFHMDFTKNGNTHFILEILEVCMEQQTDVYTFGNGQFVIQRSFGTQQTVSQILAQEITNGLLQSGVLKTDDSHDIMHP